MKVEDRLDEDRKKHRTCTLTFHENDYFTNESLVLTIKYTDSDADETDEIKGSTIEWRDGKDLTKKKIKKKQKNKKTGETREIIKTVKSESMFHIFTEAKMPAIEDDEREEDDEEF